MALDSRAMGVNNSTGSHEPVLRASEPCPVSSDFWTAEVVQIPGSSQEGDEEVGGRHANREMPSRTVEVLDQNDRMDQCASNVFLRGRIDVGTEVEFLSRAHALHCHDGGVGRTR